MKAIDKRHDPDLKDITDVWDVSKDQLKKINESISSLEHHLHKKYRGHYFDYQIVDDFFKDHSDLEKAMIFIYGQLVFERVYKKNI
ncbi:MAG: hypothetical protein QCI00_09490 [Candidatus Thermoplasmatota archaeon]|nr:hypothetical protein [Candidatus Thermoplasmatota archaeon]